MLKNHNDDNYDNQIRAAVNIIDSVKLLQMYLDESFDKCEGCSARGIICGDGDDYCE